MKQGTLLYLGMLLLLGGGFEAIRRVGTTLTPPRHIAGLWRFTLSSSADPCPILELGPAGEGELQVEQSGRYLRLIFPDTHHTRFRAYLTDDTLQGSGPSPHSCARGAMVSLSGRLTDNRVELILTRALQPPGTPTATFSLSATRTPDGAARSLTPPLKQGSNKE
jgi:hypothetical protein